ncbi:MAG TPA: OB-fold nucleic acid binding domain-containing protein, partial [Candidatus Saccharimonadales bacterium]
KKALESLIKTGAFDRFYEREVLLNNIELMIAYAAKQQKQLSSDQLNLFSEEHSEDSHLVSSKLKLELTKTKVDHKKYLTWERELLGLYLSQHPLTDLADYLKRNCTPLAKIKELSNDSPVTVGALITEVKEITTKNNQRMAFVKLEDLTGEVEMVVFPKTYISLMSYLVRDKIYKFRATVSARNTSSADDAKSLILQSLEAIDEQDGSASDNDSSGGDNEEPKLYINLKDTSDDKLLTNLKDTIDKYIGSTKVILVLDSNSARQAIRLPNGFNHQDEEGFGRLSQLVGSENLALS